MNIPKMNIPISRACYPLALWFVDIAINYVYLGWKGVIFGF
jgi:hypothetical protein